MNGLTQTFALAGTIGFCPPDDVFDHLGSVRAVIDGDTGTVIETSDYYPFGKRILSPATESTAVTGTLSVTEPVEVAGTLEVTAASMVGELCRTTGSATATNARWTAQDPLAEKYYAVSPYAYCLGNPIVNIDAQGDFVKVYIETIGLGHIWIGADNDIMNIANELFYSSERLPSEKSKRYANDPTAHIIDEYNLLNNNCTTFVSDLINKADSKVLNYQHIISVSPIGIPITIPSTHRFVNSRSMKSYLQRQIKK